RPLSDRVTPVPDRRAARRAHAVAGSRSAGRQLPVARAEAAAGPGRRSHDRRAHLARDGRRAARRPVMTRLDALVTAACGVLLIALILTSHTVAALVQAVRR